MRNPDTESLCEIGLAPELLATLRRRALRRGLSISQALSMYLRHGLASDRRPSDRHLAVAGVECVDVLVDALDGRR